MQLIDWIAIGVVLVSIIFGLLFGFGKLLKFFTGGLIGVLISIVVTYFCFGVVSSWGFTRDLMAKLLDAMQNANNSFVNLLIKIGIEKIILAVAIFIIVQILRIIIVKIIKGIVEIDNPIAKTVNRLFGMVFMLAFSCMVFLLAFHVIQLVGGETALNVRTNIAGSMFKLDWVFDNNPLKWIIERVVP